MKGQFKDEFVTAGGVPLSEVLSRSTLPNPPPPPLLSLPPSPIYANKNLTPFCLTFVKISLNTMESKIHPHLFFAGEVEFPYCSSLSFLLPNKVRRTLSFINIAPNFNITHFLLEFTTQQLK